MQKTATKAKSSSSYTRPRLQKSTTLSRRYVRRPVAVKQIDGVRKTAKKPVKKVAMKKIAVRSTADSAVSVKTSAAKKAAPAAFKAKAKAADLPKAISASVKKAKPVAKKVKPSAQTTKPSAKARADKEADKARAAIESVATMSQARPMKKHHRGRVLVAFVCSAAIVAVLGVFVAINMPNISVKVAAMQTGIDAEYPDFVPRNYSMETVASDKNGKITMKFVGPNEASFTLVEENSTWDSAAVLNNFVKENYSANYSTMHEQGITYYSDAGSAVWVNGGILYKITSYGKNLSKEQIRNLVVSL